MRGKKVINVCLLWSLLWLIVVDAFISKSVLGVHRRRVGVHQAGGRSDSSDSPSNHKAAEPSQHSSGSKSSSASASTSRRDVLTSVGRSTAAVVTGMATAQGFVTTATGSTAASTAALAATTTTTSTSTTTLGGVVGNSIELPPIGLGAWAWGDPIMWGYDKKNDEELRTVFDYAIQNSKSATTLLDTAELYGLGRSEKLIGEFSQPYPSDKIQVATKFGPLPWCTKATDVVQACEKSLARLGGRPIDLYQIHFPNAYANAAYWDGLALAYDKGLVKAVGVSNYGIDATRACHDALAKRGIPLSTNQIQLSLLYTWPLQNGLLQACNDLGVQVLSYSPLALGMLTGKYTSDKLPLGRPRKKIFKDLMTTPDYNNLLMTMKEVAAGHGTDATPAQVALNWNRAKGTIPIPGARTVNQIRGNYGALDWTLSSDEVKVLDVAASKVTTFIEPDMNPFPKQDKDTGLIMYDS